MSKKLAYGIDFGTSNSTIAVVKDQEILKLRIDPEAENPSIMRSVIYVSIDGNFLYGKPAVDAYLIDVAQGKGRTTKTIFTGRYIKISRGADIHGSLDDEWAPEIIEIDEFSGGRLLQSLKSVLADEDIKKIKLFGKEYPIEEIVGGFLKEMKARADKILKNEIDSVILGRPVRYVGKNEKVAIKRMTKAAKIAGFKNIQFEYEPIGAAYDYGNRVGKEQTVMVFDFGGGTLDISIVRFPSKKVLANVGLPIGGDYFNSKIFSAKLSKHFGSGATFGMNHVEVPRHIYEYLQNWYQATLLKTEDFTYKVDDFKFMSSDPVAIEALRSLVLNNLSFSLYDEIDRTKRKLSNSEMDRFRFKAENIDIIEEILRKDFENIIRGDINDIRELINSALKEAKIGIKDVDAIATTGGSSLIPVVRKLLFQMFGEDKVIDNDAFTSVAGGLALKAEEYFD